jgi:hypothetical protein
MASVMVLTRWFSKRTTPTRPGVYAVREPWSGLIGFAKWDGRWLQPCYDPPAAALETTASRHSRLDWRGLRRSV